MLKTNLKLKNLSSATLRKRDTNCLEFESTNKEKKQNAKTALAKNCQL